MTGKGQYQAIVTGFILLFCLNALSYSAEPAKEGKNLNGKESKREKAIREQEKETAERRKDLYKKMIEQKTFEAETFIALAKRLSGEEDNPDARELTKRAVEKKEAAILYAAKNEYESALKNLKESYSLAVQAVKKMRQDKVVTHRAIFESIEEEFDYEKDRNESYLRVASQFIKDWESKAGKLLKEAKAMREKAEEASRQGRYVEAMESMKASTNLIEEAIDIPAHRP